MLEIRSRQDLEGLQENISIVSIPVKRNDQFKEAIHLSRLIPADILKIAQNGAASVNDVRFLQESGFDGIILGEYFMKEKNPMIAFKEFFYEL